MNLNYEFSVKDRFLNYVKIDTQSDEDSTTFPSTEKQKDLANVLVSELKNLGLEEISIDEFGYVMATLPSNSDKKVPVIGLLAHLDTSPSASGKNVKPQIVKNYQGGDITLLSGDKILVEKNEALKDMHGFDIITTDGTTLLGADDKAGIAAILDAMMYFKKNPQEKHGKIRVCFTPDEEVGNGTAKFDTEKFGAEFAYTIDGSKLGEIETENFCADSVTITIHGINVHPGYAKNKMVNAIKIASHLIEALPKDKLSPETTSGKEGFVHCHSFVGAEDKTTLKFIIRDFKASKLKEYEDYLKNIANETISKFPGAKMDFEIKEQYRNMKEILDNYPRVEEYAVESLKRLGIKPIQTAIRGGTDGARLSFLGLPTPNLFAGGHNFHGILEFVAVQDLEASVKNIVTLMKIWEEKA